MSASRIAMYEEFSAAPRPLRATTVKDQGFAQSNDGAPVLLSKRFQYQSYLDTTALEKALLVQPPSEQIVGSTSTDEDVTGFAVGLHPSSETPVAVQFAGSSVRGNSPVMILTPGQIIYPQGRRRDSQFSGLRWGLPFGWLGGGLATLVVFQHPETEIEWPDTRPEVVFHRFTTQIKASNFSFTGFTASPNWPTLFPWIRALRLGTSSATISQASKPVLAVEPTRTLFRLRSTSEATAPIIRALIYGSNAFDFDSSGAAVLTAVGYEEMTFPTITQIGTNSPASQYPVLERQDGPLLRLGCDGDAAAGVLFIDTGEGGDVSNVYMDIVRYGRL